MTPRYKTANELIDAFVGLCDCEPSLADLQWLKRNIADLVESKLSASPLTPVKLSDEDLPCPFCGTMPIKGFRSCSVPGMEDCGYFEIACPKCDFGFHGDDSDEVLPKWNSRFKLDA